MGYRTGLVVALCLLPGCGSRDIDASVLDNFGGPVAGARVTISGTRFEATTGADGTFALEYAPGEFVVLAEAPGHRPSRRELSVSKRTHLPLAPLIVERVPPADGLRVAGVHDYERVAVRDLPQRRRVVDAVWRARCIDSLVPDGVPRLAGKHFLAFVPAAPGTNESLVRARDGVLASRPDNMMANCMFSAPTVVPLDSEVVGTQTRLSGDLEPGAYCFARVIDAGFSVAVARAAACFQWAHPQPDAPPEPPGANGPVSAVPPGASSGHSPMAGATASKSSEVPVVDDSYVPGNRGIRATEQRSGATPALPLIQAPPPPPPPPPSLSPARDEAWKQLEALRDAELSLHGRTGQYVSAGPCPVAVGKRGGSPDAVGRCEGFEPLGWRPAASSLCTYRVVVNASGFTAIAECDDDHDGVRARYEATDRRGPTRASAQGVR